MWDSLGKVLMEQEYMLSTTMEFNMILGLLWLHCHNPDMRH